MAEERDAPRFRYASWNTLQGKLQRGLGSGFLEALEAPREVVHTMLFECIERDPALDVHLDHRDSYYGDLALAVDLPLGRIDDFVRDCQPDEAEDSHLAVSVLIHLARRGHKDAQSILRDYVGWGPFWNFVLWSLADSGISQGWVELTRTIGERVAADSDFNYWTWEPYATWARIDPNFAPLPTSRTAAENAKQRPHPKMASRSTEELLATEAGAGGVADELAKRNSEAHIAAVREALAGPNPYSRAMAAFVLAKQDDFSGLPAAETIVSRRLGPPIARSLAAQAFALGPPEVTLPLARKWRSSPNWARQLVAFDLLEKHAEEEDYEWVARRLGRTSAEHGSERFVLTNLAEVITARFAGTEFPILGRRFDAFTYSYGRHFLAEALAATDLRFSQTRAYTSLWDCESGTREVAAKHVSLDVPGVPERLRAMAEDKLESELVKETASARLA